MNKSWTPIGSAADFPINLGSCVLVDDTQIAVFQLNTDKRWYAVQNLNPQNQRTVLSRGLIGDAEGTPIVACPLHKYRYSLEDGSCLTDEQFQLQTFEVKEENGELLLLS